MVSGNSSKVDILYSVVLFLGFILFLVMIKSFKITIIPIIIFLCILTFCLLVLTIDNKYFLYLEHGLDFAKTILPQELVIKSYLIGLPFLGIFYNEIFWSFKSKLLCYTILYNYNNFYND